jgi:alpha-tubulin suppressor-like RCC1 family protein
MRNMTADPEHSRRGSPEAMMDSAGTRESARRTTGTSLFLLALATAVIGCSDDSVMPEVPDDLPEPPTGLTVSNPVGMTVGSSEISMGEGLRASAADGRLIYVSARPGTFPDAQTITLTNVSSGGSTTVTPVDGGFDPVALAADTGDELRTDVQFAGGGVVVYVTYVPERKRPRVVRTIPPNGATEVVLSVAVTVVFSEPVDGNSLGQGGLELRRDGVPVEGTVDWSEDRLRAWFSPAEPLEAETTYHLVVTTNVLDLQGDPLEEEVQSAFTTASGILSVNAGGYHTCVLLAGGEVICWGDNSYGQCGRPAGEEILPPLLVPTSLRFTSITAGGVHTCGITVHGDAFCWGWNAWGQLGDGTTTDSYVPVLVAGEHRFQSLSTYSHHTCGVTDEGRAYCWGRHDYLQLGPGSGESCILNDSPWPCSRTPSSVGRGFKVLSVGGLFTCAITTDGTAQCWGGDHIGQLGTDSDVNIEICNGYRCTGSPRPVSGGHTFVQMSSGWGHTCGVRTDGSAYCWGNNDWGTLGAGFSSYQVRQATPLAVVGGHTFEAVAAGDDHTCALTTGGQVLCWGNNEFGQLGSGGPIGSHASEPMEVVGSHDFVGSPTSGGYYSCAATAEGDVYCWGHNAFGQLGHDPASLAMSYSPVQVPLR